MNEIGAPWRIHESIRFHFMIEHDCQMTKSQITFLRLDSKSAVEGCYKVEHEMELYVNVVILIFGLSSFMITTDRKKRLLFKAKATHFVKAYVQRIFYKICIHTLNNK